MKRLIVYDLDGTLVDTLEDIAEAANHTLKALHVPELSYDQIRRYVGRGLRTLVKDCLNTEDEQRIDAGMKIYRAYYGRHMLDHSRLYANTDEVLAYFSRRRQAVLTNKPNPYSRQMLEKFGIADCFVEIIAGDSGYPKKPDPAALLALMDRQRSLPKDTLLIGDSPIDVETGRGAGVCTVGVAHGLSDEEDVRLSKPDVLVKNFKELLTLAQHHKW
ncbi:MAG: HAD-IA family hydrolase [Nitrososphaera sp.]|nr:HAD-IA family hydrolase [Nitrososphaera sp.]